MAVVKKCHEKVHAMGAPRITTTIKMGTRTDRDQKMADKIESVEQNEITLIIQGALSPVQDLLLLCCRFTF